MLTKQKKAKLLILFLLVFLFTSISSAYACVVTVVFINVFTRILLAIVIVIFIWVSAEGTTFSVFTSGLLWFLSGIMFLLGLKGDWEVLNSEAIILFTYLLIFALLIAIRMYYKFYRKEKEVHFFAGLIIIFILLVFISRSTFCTVCYPSVCHGRLNELGRGLEQYSYDHNGLYPSALSELTPAYLPEEMSCTICKLDGASFLFPFVPLEVEEMGKYKETPYEYTVNAERTSYTISCHNKIHELVYVDEGYPQFTSRQGLIGNAGYP